jgi:hypothetical protein
MSAVGPVCHIPPQTIVFKPQPVAIPAVPPPAEANLASLQNTVNTLRQIILTITGQNGVNGQNGANGSSAPGGSFEQTQVQTQTVRVFQNNDPTSPNFVDVQFVSQVKFQNNATKSTIVFNAPANAGGQQQ